MYKKIFSIVGFVIAGILIAILLVLNSNIKVENLEYVPTNNTWSGESFIEGDEVKGIIIDDNTHSDIECCFEYEGKTYELPLNISSIALKQKIE